jgi:hypothetical protein
VYDGLSTLPPGAHLSFRALGDAFDAAADRWGSETDLMVALIERRDRVDVDSVWVALKCLVGLATLLLPADESPLREAQLSGPREPAAGRPKAMLAGSTRNRPGSAGWPQARHSRGPGG